MEITVSQEQGRISVSVIKLTGHLDGQTYESLISKAREIVEAGSRNILLDLGDDAGAADALGAAGSTLKSMDRTRDGGLQKNLKLLNPRPEITSVLDMVGFAAFFETFTDRQKAIDSF